MANELDILSNNEIAPYKPGVPGQELAPHNHDQWARSDLDEVRHAPSQSQRTLFGTPTQATPGQVEAMLGQLGGAFMHDFSALGFPSHMVQAALQFVTANATKAPYQVTPTHGFNLHGEDDYLAHGFGNMVAGLSGSPRAKQQFVTACLQWLAKANKQLASQQQVGTQPRTATPTSDPTANLTDAQYNQLVAHNNAVQAQTMATLEQRWGQCFKVNIELAQAQLNKQTPAELAHLNRYTGEWPWTHMFNTVELLTAMYEMSIGANSIGTGADIAREIAQFEAMLKVPSERARYMKDPQLQARLRELYSRRDGG
jgi:hypothetical protein